jgi:NADH-quinone oxidoreductase subunit A
MAQYLPLLVMFVLAGVFAGVSFLASGLLAPRRPTAAKEAPYECGIVPDREPPERFPVRFYLVAMIFVIFDIEIVFLYPLAVILHELAWFGFLEFLVFLLILLVAYVYIWKKGALEWH